MGRVVGDDAVDADLVVRVHLGSEALMMMREQHTTARGPISVAMMIRLEQAHSCCSRARRAGALTDLDLGHALRRAAVHVQHLLSHQTVATYA